MQVQNHMLYKKNVQQDPCIKEIYVYIFTYITKKPTNQKPNEKSPTKICNSNTP